MSAKIRKAARDVRKKGAAAKRNSNIMTNLYQVNMDTLHENSINSLNFPSNLSLIQFVTPAAVFYTEVSI